MGVALGAGYLSIVGTPYLVLMSRGKSHDNEIVQDDVFLASVFMKWEMEQKLFTL
jgi:hypothetical protein